MRPFIQSLLINDIIPHSIFSIGDKRGDIGLSREVCATVERTEFDNEVDVDFLGIHAFYEVVDSSHCAACRENIVMDNDNIIGGDCVAVNFDYVYSIFFLILGFDSVSRQFTGFAGRHETGTEFKSED